MGFKNEQEVRYDLVRDLIAKGYHAQHIERDLPRLMQLIKTGEPEKVGTAPLKTS